MKITKNKAHYYELTKNIKVNSGNWNFFLVWDCEDWLILMTWYGVNQKFFEEVWLVFVWTVKFSFFGFFLLKNLVNWKKPKRGVNPLWICPLMEVLEEKLWVVIWGSYFQLSAILCFLRMLELIFQGTFDIYS